MILRRVSLAQLLAVGALVSVAACDGGGVGPSNGSAGSTATAGSTGTAGTTGGGAGDTGSTGTAGSTSSGAGGDTGAAGAIGAAGSTGTAGSTGAAGTPGTAGSTGAAGTPGTAGSTGAGGGAVSPGGGMSAGCGKAIGAGDMPGKWVKRNITVTGVTFTKPATPGGSWTNRIYYLNLPTGYDPSKKYPVMFGGGGCGGDLSNGNMAFAIYGNNSTAIQIGMSYVWPNPGGACFSDGYADTPDLPYFDSMLKELEANYCVDTGHVFVGGYSSGGWESYMLGFARGGIVRGISPAAGGLRPAASRPPAANKPFAAIMVTGASDTTNPPDGATGSMAARDLILQINGCQGTATAPYPDYVGGNCTQYTGCPADYPVIYCRPVGGHTDGGGAFKTAIGKLWSQLK
jgi:poly(3-hydroxybutyrate) depolymerase